jgi:hypothetical protein
MIELCPRCGKNLALAGYMHLCAPLLTHAPKAKAVTENRVTKNPPPPVTKIQEVTSSHMHRRVRKQGNAVPSGGKQRLPRRQLMPVTRRADIRRRQFMALLGGAAASLPHRPNITQIASARGD